MADTTYQYVRQYADGRLEGSNDQKSWEPINGWVTYDQQNKTYSPVPAGPGGTASFSTGISSKPAPTPATPEQAAQAATAATTPGQVAAAGPGQGPVKFAEDVTTGFFGLPENWFQTSLTAPPSLDEIAQTLQGLGQFVTNQGAPVAWNAGAQRGGVTGRTEQALSLVPWVGPMAVQAMEDVQRGKLGRGIGESFGLGMFAKSLPETASALWEGPVRSAAQAVGGIGKERVQALGERALETNAVLNERRGTQVLRRNADLMQQHLNDVQQANEQIAKIRADTDAANAAATQGDIEKFYESRARAAQTKREIDANNDQVREKMALREQADKQVQQITDRLPADHDSVRTAAKANYPDVGGEDDPTALYNDLQKAVSEKLRGVSNPSTSLKALLARLQPTAAEIRIGGRPLTPMEQWAVAAAKDALKNGGDPDEIRLQLETQWPDRARATKLWKLAQASPTTAAGPEPLSFEQLHALASELFWDSLDDSLDGNQKAATTAARDVIFNHMGALADAQGPNVRAQFDYAQKVWSNYENTFNNTRSSGAGGGGAQSSKTAGSPVARSFRARNNDGTLRSPWVQETLFGNDDEFDLAMKQLQEFPQAATLRALMADTKAKIDLSRNSGVIQEVPEDVERAFQTPFPQPTANPAVIPPELQARASAAAPTLQSFAPGPAPRFDPVAARMKLLANAPPPRVSSMMFFSPKWQGARFLGRWFAGTPAGYRYMVQTPTGWRPVWRPLITTLATAPKTDQSQVNEEDVP